MLELLVSIAITGLSIFGNLLNILLGFAACTGKDEHGDESRESDLTM